MVRYVISTVIGVAILAVIASGAYLLLRLIVRGEF